MEFDVDQPSKFFDSAEDDEEIIEREEDFEKIFINNLSGRAKRAYQVWKKYYQMSVWRNEHLCIIMFLYVCGTILTYKGLRYQSHGELFAPRINPFIIQRSGSGKSQAMKAAHKMLAFLDCKGSYITKTTDASLVGTFFEAKKNSPPLVKYGLLQSYDYLIWDEGSVFLKEAQYSENLPDIIQMTTDDPGYVCKALRLGEIKFFTNTAICAGTYMDGSITATIFKKGMFQRMLLTLHKVAPEEIDDYLLNEAMLVSISPKDKLNIMQEFRSIIDEITLKNYPKELDSVGIDRATIQINNDDLIDINKNVIINTSSSVAGLFTNSDFRLDIMQSFLSRRNQIRQISAILSGMNEDLMINKTNLLIGFNLWRDHLRAANNLLLMGSGVIKADSRDARFDTIKRVITEMASPAALIKIIEEVKNQPKWDTGESNIRRLINDMHQQNMIEMYTKKGLTYVKLVTK